MGKVKEFVGLSVTCAMVFVSAGCMTVLGLLCWRLMARDVGGSIYTWTAVLGLGLLGLCLGGRLGGWAADRYHARRILAILYALLSAACVGIILLSHALVQWDWLWGLSWPVHVFLHVGMVLLLPTVFLGAIGPVTIKQALDLGFTPGRTIGGLLTWAAAGAVVGTFLAGFYLIPRFDSVAMIWVIGATMLGMAMLYWISCWALYIWAMIFGTLVMMGMAPAQWAYDAGVGAYLRDPNDPGILYEDQTAYGQVTVRRLSERSERRVLWQDSSGRLETIVGYDTDLQSVTDRICAGLIQELSGNKESPSMLILGGRGYFLARCLQASQPDSSITVVEPDPGVIEAAQQAMGPEDDGVIETVTMDARYYVQQLLKRGTDQRYDFVYQNVAIDCSAPFQLLTMEFNEKLASRLAPDAVYMVTLTDTYESGRFLGAVVATLERTFPHVHILREREVQPLWPEAFVVVATPCVIDPATLLEAYDRHLAFRSLDESEMSELRDKGLNVVLTDDLAPVENLLAPAAWQVGPKRLANRYLQQAEVFQARGMYAQSEAMYQRVVTLEPSASVRAYNEIGLMRLAKDDSEGSAEYFARAIRSRKELDLWEPEIASVYMNLGLLLRRMKKPLDAREQFLQAAKWFRIDLMNRPDSVVLWERLGDTLVLTGDMKEASEAFEKALELEPENPNHYTKLTRALEKQRRYDEAIAVARRHLTLLKARKERDKATQLSQYIELLEYERVKAGK